MIRLRKSALVVIFEVTSAALYSSIPHTARRWGWCTLCSRTFLGSSAARLRRSKRGLARICRLCLFQYLRTN